MDLYQHIMKLMSGGKWEPDLASFFSAQNTNYFRIETDIEKNQGIKSPSFSIQLPVEIKTDLNSKGFSIKHVGFETVIALSLKYDTKEGIVLKIVFANRNNNCCKMNDTEVKATFPVSTVSCDHESHEKKLKCVKEILPRT